MAVFIIHKPISILFVLLMCSYNLIFAQEDNTITGPDGGGFFTTLMKTFRNPPENALRTQPHYTPESRLPCSGMAGYRSPVRPTSVHMLRPGDIDVVGAMGDSLVAANGAMENWAMGAFIEHRGVSWCAGGDATWREYMTLPNLIKEFNPNLTGFSTGVGDYRSSNSKFNIGYPVSSAMDTLMQAQILVNRMKKDPNVDFKNDWKMVTLFFGDNDICSVECFSKDLGSPTAFKRNLQKGLDYLQENLPRAIINMVPVVDVTLSVRMKRTPICYLLHSAFCRCFYRGNYDHMTYLASLAVKYQKGVEQLALSGRYDKKDDFTVVYQPFMKLFNLPHDKSRHHEEVIDVSFVSHDCFHFSQKGHALAANLLWNNLLEPVGNKTIKNMDFIMQKFNCPSEKAPYIFTNKNSQKYFATGFQ